MRVLQERNLGSTVSSWFEWLHEIPIMDSIAKNKWAATITAWTNSILAPTQETRAIQERARFDASACTREWKKCGASIGSQAPCIAQTSRTILQKIELKSGLTLPKHDIMQNSCCMRWEWLPYIRPVSTISLNIIQSGAWSASDESWIKLRTNTWEKPQVVAHQLK